MGLVTIPVLLEHSAHKLFSKIQFFSDPVHDNNINLLNPGARNFAHYTVLNTWYSDLLLPGIIGQLFAKVWVICVTT